MPAQMNQRTTIVMRQSRTYSELITINDYYERLKYLMLNGRVSELTFGSHRYLNQVLYSSKEWQRVRREVILRDNGCDLAHKDYPISGRVYIHHLEPITIEDIQERSPNVFDLNNLVCVSFDTHQAIHYGTQVKQEWKPRTENDTIPWR